jgi:drug/metabolite transporter (DMT)-like permease
MSRVLKAHLAVLIVNLIYGANFTIAKGVMPQYIKPLGFVALRVSVACLLFLVIYRLFIREKLNREDVPRLALCGLFGVAINQMLFFKGLALTTPINGSIIMTTNPILVLITAAILIREKITLRKISGIVLGIAGALLLLAFGRHFSFGGSTFTGDLFIFINAMSYGIFLVIAKPLMKKYNPITIITWVFLFGSIVVLPFGFSELTQIPWSTLPGSIWTGVLYVVLAVTFIAYLLNTWALNTLSPSVVSFYIYLQPLFTTAISLFTGNDELTPIKIASSLLIFTGVYLISIPPREKLADPILQNQRG